MEVKQETATFCPASRKAWRQWLIKHHAKEPSVWLICHKKSAGVPTISWSDAVAEALCFGWIDSTRKTMDDDRFMQFFTKRKPRSPWSKVNKDHVERLIAQGLMTPAGLATIDTAKQNGSWTIADAAETLEIPADLAAAFKAHNGAETYFLGLSRSVRKNILHWVGMAKRTETRQKRITEIAEHAAQGQKPKQFR